MVGLIDPFAPVPMPTAVDVDRVRRESLGRVDTMMQGGLAGIAPQTPAQQTQPTAPSGQLLFNPVTNEMSAGGRTFAADDIKSVLSVPDYLQSPTGPEPVGPEWKVMSPGEYAARAKAFSERRGALENLGRGATNLAGSLVGGVGAGLELGGATNWGAGVRDFAQDYFRYDENDQLRSQLIAQNSTLVEKLWDGTLEAGPSVALVVGATLATGGIAGALGAGAAGVTASSAAGGVLASFPLHLDSFFTAAQENGYDTNDPAIKGQILAGAFGNTLLDGIGINGAARKLASRVLLNTAEEAGQVAARSALRNGLSGAWDTAWKEGLTEGLQTFHEKVLFDPEIRDQLSASDWKALAPSLLNAGFSEDVLMSAGIGAILGGGVGGLTNLRATPGTPQPKSEVGKDKPVDLNAKAAEQVTPTTAPMTGLGPVVPNLSPEEAALAANWEANNALGPAIPSLGTSEQALADQWQSTLGPMPLTPEMRQAAAAADTTKGRTLLAPGAPQPAAAPAPMETLILRPSQRADGRAPMLLAPSEMVQPTTPAPMERLLLRPSQRADARRPMLLAPSEMVQPAASAAPEAAPTAPVTEPAAETRPAAPQLKPIPFDQYARKPDSAELIPGTNVRGEATIIDLGGRKVVLRDVNGVQVPFYLSTGAGGKVNVAAGKWYPFFGIGPDGWLIKGSPREINDYHGSPELRAAAEELDATIGDIRNDTSVPKVKPSGAHIDAINAGLNPVANGEDNTRDVLNANLADLLARIRAGAPEAAPAAPAAAPEPVVTPVANKVGPELFGHVNNQARVRRALAAIKTLVATNPDIAQVLKANLAQVRVEVVGGTADPARNKQDRKDLDLVIDEGYEAPGVRDPDLGAALERLQNYINESSTVEGKGDMQAMMGAKLPGTPSVDISPLVQAVIRDTNPPTKPTTPTGKARVQRQAAEKPAAPKQATVQMAEAMARGRAAKKVRERVAVLSKAQKDELMGRLGVPDMAAVDAAITADPAAVSAVVDEIVAPKSTPPTGGKKPGANAEKNGQKSTGTAPKNGSKGDNLTSGRNKSALDEAAAAKAKADEEAKAKAKADEEAKAKADEEAAAAKKAQTPTQEVTVVPDANGELATRVPKRSAESKALGLDYDYYIVKLSDDRVFETRVVDGKWVFRADTSLPVEAADGVKLTAKTMPEAVARMASEGKLDGLRAESMLTPGKGKPAEPDLSPEKRAEYEGIKADIEELEAKLGSPNAPMEGDRLQAALDLMATRDDPATPNALKELATAVLEEGTTPKTLVEAELAYAKQTSTRKGKAKAEKQVEMPEAVSKLIDLIEKFNMRPANASSAIPAEFAALARTVADKHPDAVYSGRPLTDYFSGSKPNLKEVFGRRQIVPVDGTGHNALADFNTLVGAVDLNGKPVVPLAPGRVNLLVRNFTTKLKVAPKLTVVRNQADLQAKNPRLYLRAKNARTDGTFDTAEAMGYSFGDGEVILFTDRIATEQQLNFVLAHETLGHFGMRAIMPADKFNAVMDKVYNSDPLLRTSVDMAVATRGMTRAEATEEYLADHAAVIEMSYLRWVAAALKDALNVIGFRFSDDMTRHLIRMSRRYVRNGKRDNLFSASSIFADIQTIESGGDQLGTGRFKQGFKTDNLRTDLLNYDVFGGIPRTVEDVTAGLKEGGERLSTTMETAINKFFSLTAFRARDNAGLAELVRVLSRATEIAAEVRNRADEIMRESLNTELKFMGVRLLGGITRKEQDASSFLNYTQQDNIRGKVDEKVDKVVKALRDSKKLTRMFTISGDQVVPNTDAIEAYRDAGRLSLSEAKAILAKDKRYADIAAELTETHPTWEAYERTREAFEVSELQFVKTQYAALLEDRKNAQMSMFDMLPPPPVGEEKVLLPGDYAMFNTWAAKHFEILAEGATTVEDNIVATESGTRAADEFSKKVNAAIIAKGFDNTTEEAIRKYFKGKQADDFIAQVVAFRKRVVRNADNEFLLQAKIKEFGAAELSYTSAEMSARKLLVQGYTPIVRKQQRYQITVSAYDADTGERVELDGEYKGMAVYRTVGTMEEGTALASRMQDIFSDTSKTEFEDTTVKEVDGKLTRTYKVSGRTAKESDAKTRQVVLRAEVSAAVSGMTTPLNLNLNEFLRGLRQYGLNIHPEKLEQIVTDMTSQDARARKRLEQTGNPGYQVEGGINALQAMSQHIDGRASLIAKIQLRPEIDRLLNVKLESSRKLWFGDKKRLKDLKDTYERLSKDPNANEDAVFLAKAEYDDYAYKMRNTITTKNGVDINLGNKFLTEAHSLMAFVNGNRDLNESDWGAGPVASWLRRWISSVQLGGTLSQPIMNNIGPFTNFVPWLASYNPKNGFGGNAGVSKAYVAYLHALSDVGGGGGVSFSKRALEMHTADYWDQVATGMVEHDGVSQFEAEFIANETRKGILTPAQANSLMGASRNYTTNPALRRALDKWMFFYLSSEQATRRAAALAAFRVEMNRQLSATGLTIEQLSDPKFADKRKAMYARASKFATDGVTLTLGDYNALNRPAAWRSGLQSFLYMYRVWPTTSIQTLSRLDNTGKALFLLPLLILSGVAGLPFAEDLEDILDTIAQRTGMSIGSVRLEAARLIDEIFPGLSPYILNGSMTALLGVDTSGRFGMGDFVPGSAAFLPGQELSETIKDVVGPAWGFIEGTFKGGSELVAAPFSETATVVNAMREGPVTLFRSLGDAYIYQSTGAVIDKRGYVIQPEGNTQMLMARVFGFTPGSVAADYELIRLAKRETNYQKQVVARIRRELLIAEMSGDKATAASLRRTVKEWNEATKGTLLEIKNFEKNYQALKKKATMSARERFLQSAGKANQDAIEFIGELVMYD